MYSEPEIVTSKNSTSRSYVKVYIDGKRHRFYNGKQIGIVCNPNHSKTINDRDRALTHLCYNLKKKLEQGWSPQMTNKLPLIQDTVVPSVLKTFETLQSEISNENLSVVYDRDLTSLCNHFKSFCLTENIASIPITELSSDHIQLFLKRYNSSATNYMNKRRALSALFNRISHLQENPVCETRKMKQFAHLNIPYKQGQLKTVLNYLQENHHELFICCLLMYGCLLRPHQEIRLLKRSSFNEEIKSIALSGNQNKGKRIRVVLIPEYVRKELLSRSMSDLPAEANIFSGRTTAYNMSYFSTAWARIKEQLCKDGIIGENHTLYSFRHTAAINMYLKTKDPYKIQQAFGHSSLKVTLTYLRNLGLVIDSSIDDLPDL
ncbi:MAG: tyrosine-type recombinase/integrase [Bacteroidetes bacterium]|nr:tyrosine-type recombinase/integrase [Bacteroidota bacterium]